MEPNNQEDINVNSNKDNLIDHNNNTNIKKGQTTWGFGL